MYFFFSLVLFFKHKERHLSSQWLVMKPTWQLPIRFVTPNLALQAIIISKAQM